MTDKQRQVGWDGRYAVFGQVSAGDTVKLIGKVNNKCVSSLFFIGERHICVPK